MRQHHPTYMIDTSGNKNLPKPANCLFADYLSRIPHLANGSNFHAGQSIF